WIMALSSNRPGQAVRLAASIYMPCHLQALQVDYGEVVVRRTCDEGAMAIRIHQNPCCPVANSHPLEFLARRCFIDDQIAIAQTRDQHKLSIRSELQPVCSEGPCVQRGGNRPGRKVDHRKGAVLRICG